jgi:hypothetical protein
MNEDQLIEVLQGIKAGRKWQYKDVEYGWTVAPQQSVIELLRFVIGAGEARLEPVATHIMVNGVKVPAPLRVGPTSRIKYYRADPSMSELYKPYYWDDAPTEHLWIERGLVHLTQDAAVAHARAMVYGVEK